MNFYRDVIMRDTRFSSVQRCADIELLEPRFRDHVCNIIKKAAALNISLKVWETYRSEQRQLSLYQQKATKLRTVGVHHYGLAADIVKWVNGEPSWRGDWAFFGNLAREEGLTWGGDWDRNSATLNHFNDMDHVQFVTIERQPALFAGTWYP